MRHILKEFKICYSFYQNTEKNVSNVRLIVCEYSTAGNNKRQHYSRSAAATEKFSITIITF